MDCIFCKIINKEIPSEIIFEDEEVIVFKDIKPKAPVHLLIVPKKHIESINEAQEEDKKLIGKLFLVARDFAKKMGVSDSGYKLLINVGEGGGQEVFHLHVHLMGGWN